MSSKEDQDVLGNKGTNLVSESSEQAAEAADLVASVAGRELIDAERLRQKTEEGWNEDHDSEHDAGDLARAAQCYQDADAEYWAKPRPYLSAPGGWPWAILWWKPKDALRNLVRAGALYQAEIDSLRRRRLAVEIAIDILNASALSGGNNVTPK